MYIRYNKVCLYHNARFKEALIKGTQIVLWYALKKKFLKKMNVVVRNINTDNLTQGKGSTVRHFIVNKLN